MTDRATPEITVWDPLVRLFHWTLVLAFVFAFCSQSGWFEKIREPLLSEESLQTLHIWAGYTIVGLLLFRLIWGLVGPRYARFSDFVYGPRAIFAYTKAVLTLQAPRHLGHNPAGGAMIIVLLLSLAITVSAGLMLYGADKGLGPLAGLLIDSSDSAIDAFKEVHELFANFTVVLVVGHLTGVVWESLLHRENLALAMITGRKRG
ncbi:MAG: cytochrome b/b6 domain-containing protein [Candidatus Contendobacter sp.]|jgi:cytochrome b|nr:cytochrome b/b6 domain-containing protein [Candidatus Contendobacter sp.]